MPTDPTFKHANEIIGENHTIIHKNQKIMKKKIFHCNLLSHALHVLGINFRHFFSPDAGVLALSVLVCCLFKVQTTRPCVHWFLGQHNCTLLFHIPKKTTKQWNSATKLSFIKSTDSFQLRPVLNGRDHQSISFIEFGVPIYTIRWR